MMGNQLKEKDGSVTLRIKGGGPLGGITVVSDSQGNAGAMWSIPWWTSP